MTDVAIIDYNMGNLYSIDCALKYVGLKSKITDDLDIIKKSKCLILPGVGAFPEAMKRLKEKKLDLAIKNFNQDKKPIIGICLGMQLLFNNSNENGSTTGLGLLDGEVKKFNLKDKENNIKTFNVGWRKILLNKKIIENNSLNKDNNNLMYFIHSYFCKPENKNIQTSSSFFYSKEFTSSVKKENIEAFQFHPEKSGKAGINIYLNLKKNLR